MLARPLVPVFTTTRPSYLPATAQTETTPNAEEEVKDNPCPLPLLSSKWVGMNMGVFKSCMVEGACCGYVM